MNQTSNHVEKATADAVDELALLRQRIAEARATLQGLQSELEASEVKFRDREATLLLQANQRLIAPVLIGKSEEWTEEVGEHLARIASLVEANEQLVFAAIGAKTLVSAAREAQQRHTELLAVVAHELRSPLAPIRAASDLLGRQPASPELVTKVRTILDRQVAHMSRLIGDLLDVGRISKGKLRVDRHLLSMGPILEAAIDTFKTTLERRHQTLVVRADPPATAVQVHGDAVRLTQVLINLLDNASKYTPPKGHLGLEAKISGLALLITVTDDGIGMSTEALTKVFEPFVQDSQAVSFNNAGLGIGLTVVREIVEAHGGLVVARSAGRNKGSEVVVTLPLAVL